MLNQSKVLIDFLRMRCQSAAAVRLSRGKKPDALYKMEYIYIYMEYLPSSNHCLFLTVCVCVRICLRSLRYMRSNNVITMCVCPYVQ